MLLSKDEARRIAVNIAKLPELCANKEGPDVYNGAELPRTKDQSNVLICGACVMGDSTLLSPVRKGGIWRVRITWPNGKVHFVGKFSSEKDAIEWIEAHPRLTKPVTDEPRANPLADHGASGNQSRERIATMIRSARADKCQSRSNCARGFLE
jgi:hypothetical protein